MNSIKEKSKGYGLLNPDIHYDANGNTYDDVDKPSMDFEAGANYVLECIEESIKNSPAGYGLIYHIIEQLKK